MIRMFNFKDFFLCPADDVNVPYMDVAEARGLTKMSSKILEIRPSATEQEVAEIILDF